MTYWEIPIRKLRILMIFGIAISMTTLAEFLYLTVWGFWLFPDGNLITKIIWTTICGIAMGTVIGAATLVFVEGVYNDQKAILISGLVMAAVGTSCAVLCSQIDQNLNYFGGRDHPMMFVLSGMIPAVVGGLLYGWLLYSPRLLSFLTSRPVADQ